MSRPIKHLSEVQNFLWNYDPANLAILRDMQMLGDSVLQTLAIVLLKFEPPHEITVLFVLRKLILQMHVQPSGGTAFLVGPFIYFHTSCV